MQKNLSVLCLLFSGHLVVIRTWPPVPHEASALHQACKQGKSTVEFPELLFASRSCTLAPYSSNLKSHMALVLCRPWPPWWAGPTIQLACLSRWNVHLHTEREIMCRLGTCLLSQCPHRSLPVNPYFLGRSHKVSLCC